jgi:RNA polymerase sigma factor (sigma-70 family)
MGNRELPAIHFAVSQLPPRQREAESLVLLASLPTREAAEEMGVSPATVRSLLRHAFKHLRSRLEQAALRQAISTSSKVG